MKKILNLPPGTITLECQTCCICRGIILPSENVGVLNYLIDKPPRADESGMSDDAKRMESRLDGKAVKVVACEACTKAINDNEHIVNFGFNNGRLRFNIYQAPKEQPKASATIFMDFCPSESLGGANKYPESPFTAASCVFLTDPDKEQEIHAEIRRRRKKTKKSRLWAMAFLRKKIENGEVGVFALCTQRTESILFAEGAINCLNPTTMKFLAGLPPAIVRSSAQAEAKRIAEELGVSEHSVISNMATFLVSHWSVIYFLEAFQKSGIFRGGLVRVVIDKLPGNDNKLKTFQAVKSHHKTLPELYLKHYGATVIYEPLGDKEEDPCGLLVSDLLANVSAAVTDSIRRPGDNFPPAKHSPQLPDDYTDEEKDEIRKFLNFMLKNNHLLMATPEMLRAVTAGGKAKEKIFAAQTKYGLDYPDHLDPREFI